MYFELAQKGFCTSVSKGTWWYFCNELEMQSFKDKRKSSSLVFLKLCLV